MPVRRMMRKRNYRRRYRARPKLAKSFVGKVKRVINAVAEKKYHPFAGSTTVSSVGYLLDLTNIAQGDTDLTRDGDSLYVKSIQLCFDVAVADSYNQVRMIIFQWIPPSDLTTGTPTAALLLTDTAAPTISPFAHDSRQDYRILMDKSVILDTNNPYKCVRFFVTRRFRRKVQFVSGTVYGQGNIYCYLFSDSGAAPHPAFTWSGKVNFLDS